MNWLRHELQSSIACMYRLRRSKQFRCTSSTASGPPSPEGEGSGNTFMQTLSAIHESKTQFMTGNRQFMHLWCNSFPPAKHPLTCYAGALPKGEPRRCRFADELKAFSLIGEGGSRRLTDEVETLSNTSSASHLLGSFPSRGSLCPPASVSLW